MAYQRVPETAEIVIEYLLANVTVINTYHATLTGGYNQTNITDLANQIDNVAVTGLLADQSINLAYVQTVVRGLDAENDLSAVANLNAGSGGNANSSMPANVAFCVQKLSGLTGRNARGRVYIPGIPQNFRATGTPNINLITTVAADAYKAHIDAFRTTIENVATWQASIVSRYHNGSKRAEAVTFRWTDTQYKDQKFDTMRRRMD